MLIIIEIIMSFIFLFLSSFDREIIPHKGGIDHVREENAYKNAGR